MIITGLRKPYHYEYDFTDLALARRSADVVVKIDCLEPEPFDMSAGRRVVLTPGGADQHLVRLRHRRIRIIPPSSEPLTGEDE